MVSTLEAAVWCLLNNATFPDTVLSAVNLGGDSDTTGAVAGGLAGVCYGYGTIPGIGWKGWRVLKKSWPWDKSSPPC